MTVVESIFVFGVWFLRMVFLRSRCLRSRCLRSAWLSALPALEVRSPRKNNTMSLIVVLCVHGDAGRMISATIADIPRSSRFVRFIGDENE